MLQKLKYEWKIAGVNFPLVSAGVSLALLVLAAMAGTLLDVSAVAFEVVFPFFAAIAVGERGKTRADRNFDILAAQLPSLPAWAVLRYGAVFGAVSAFAFLCMVGVSCLREEAPLGTMVLLYFPPAFFLSALSLLAGLASAREHAASLLCGLVWLTALLTRSLLRIEGMAYIYLFARFAGIQCPTLLWNKLILLIAGGTLLGAACWVAKRRPW